MQRSAWWSVSILILVSLVMVPSTAAAAPAVPLGDGVVVDAARGMAYLANAAGKLDAVELGRGKVVWSAETAAKPLAAAGDLVIAQAEPAAAGTLEIVSFDAATGRSGKMKSRVELPGHVKAGLRDTPGKSFRAAARVDGSGLLVSWLATSASGDQAMRGYLPSIEEGGDPAAERVSAAVRVDLDSGAATPAPAAVASPATIEALPASAVPGATGNLFASADGRHVLASERQIGDDLFQSYSWTIYARDGGEPIGQMASISSVAPFVVVDGKLVYLSQRSIRSQGKKMVDEPMSLRAFDLARGKPAWSREVSDPAFRGPFPH